MKSVIYFVVFLLLLTSCTGNEKGHHLQGLTKKPCFVFLVSSFHPVGFLGIALEL
jgi:hypothetical protein